MFFKDKFSLIIQFNIPQSGTYVKWPCRSKIKMSRRMVQLLRVYKDYSGRYGKMYYMGSLFGYQGS